MKNFLILVFIGVLFIILAQVNVFACTCVDLGDPLKDKVAWWLKGSTAAFSGETIKLEKIAGTREMIATFSVDEFWKGDLSTIVEVKTPIDGASCGYDFRIGTAYLVYASKVSDTLVTGLCGGNRRRYEAVGEGQINILGKGKVPEKKKL